MDMGTTTMSMAATGTSAATTATSTTMPMTMNMGSTCQVSMLWNWYTIDACFIASSWHITSTGMFAGSCIGVILLVMSLEFLRRVSKEYDRYILRQYTRSFLMPPNPTTSPTPSTSNPSSTAKVPEVSKKEIGVVRPFRPHILEQMVRATLHMLQFAVAYFVMLLAMYFNGYIIISIIIGAWLGSFVFSWETVGVGSIGGDEKEEATYCCG